MTDYPEHEKLQAVREKSQAIGEFIEWLQGTKHYVIAQWQQVDPDTEPGELSGADEGLFSASFSIETLLAEYFEIDLKKLEQEKQKMLEDMRKANQRFDEKLASAPHLTQCPNCGHTWKARAQRKGSKKREIRCSKCHRRIE